MQKRLISIFKFTFFFGLGIFLVWWSIKNLSEDQFQKFIAALKTADYFLLLPVFFILSLSHLSRALRWKILMRSMGYNPKLSNTFCAVMVGYLANFAFPRLGEVLKCKLVGTILVERAVDLLSFGIIIIISLLTQAKIVGAYTKEKLTEIFLTGNRTDISIRFSIFITIAIIVFFAFKYISKKYHHIKIVDKIKSIIKGIAEGLLSVKKLKNKWLFIFHSVLIWTCYLAGTYVGFLAIKETAALPILAAFPVLVFGSLATIITPGGIGAYPDFLMKAMLLYNIEEGKGYANGMLQWSAQFVITLVVGFICLAALPYINKIKHESGPINT